MDEEALLEELQATGHLTVEQLDRWRRASGLLAVFDAIGRDGANALVKVDGGRTNGAVYTVVISGGKLGGDYFHKDGGDLYALLEEAISYYRARVWSTLD